MSSPYCSCWAGEVDRMALVAGLQHLIALGLPGGLIESRNIGRLHHIEARCGLAAGIKHAQRLQNGDLVGLPLGIVGQRQPHGKESPPGAHFMVALLHVAGLASWRCGVAALDHELLELVPHAVFRGGVHLPLRMIEAHVTGLTSLRRARFLD